MQTTTLLRWPTGECLQDRGGACSESTKGTRRTESWNPLNDGQVLRNCNAVVVDLGHQDVISLRLPFFSLLAPTVTVGQDVFAWVPCPEHTSPPSTCTRVLWLYVVVYDHECSCVVEKRTHGACHAHAPMINACRCARASDGVRTRRIVKK